MKPSDKIHERMGRLVIQCASERVCIAVAFLMPDGTITTASNLAEDDAAKLLEEAAARVRERSRG